MRVSVLILAVLTLSGCTSTSRDFNEGGSIRAKTSSGAEVVVSQSDNPRTGASLRVLDSADGPVIEASTGETYENTLGKLKEMFGAFKIYHLAAVACAIVGAVILGTGFLPNRWGLTLIGLAVGLGSWAHLMPVYGGRIAVALGVFAVAGTGYWLYEKGLFSPTPDK
jgi:hypothetical protein